MLSLQTLFEFMRVNRIEQTAQNIFKELAFNQF